MSVSVDIGFYHLTRTKLEDALPVLLGKTLEGGERAIVRCLDDAQVVLLDTALWNVKEPVWLPHGTERSGHAAWQPIWLTAQDDVPNAARFLFRVNGAGALPPDRFQRVFDLFDGHDEQHVQHARERWKALKDAGYTPVYWKQASRGWARSS